MRCSDMIYTWYLQVDFPDILFSMYSQMASRWAPMIFSETEARLTSLDFFGSFFYYVSRTNTIFVFSRCHKIPPISMTFQQ